MLGTALEGHAPNAGATEGLKIWGVHINTVVFHLKQVLFQEDF